jgi:murein L,D-transpeptidase YafK
MDECYWYISIPPARADTPICISPTLGTIQCESLAQLTEHASASKVICQTEQLLLSCCSFYSLWKIPNICLSPSFLIPLFCYKAERQWSETVIKKQNKKKLYRNKCFIWNWNQEIEERELAVFTCSNITDPVDIKFS